MKTRKEILEEIEILKKSRDSFVVSTMEWFMIDGDIKKLEWVLGE